MRKAEYIEYLKKHHTKILPLYMYPMARTIGMNPYEVTSNWEKQVEVMMLIDDLYDFGFIVGLMDLTLEVEAFGMQLRYDMINLPILGPRVIKTATEAREFLLPSIEFGRIAQHIKAIQEAKKVIEDKPLIATVAGPFTLASMLLGIDETKDYIKENTEIISETLIKVSMFMKRYLLALIDAGADGIFISEPMVDKLSSLECDVFSTSFINDILTVLDDESFVIYHNCGDTNNKLNSIKSTTCDIYHFGEMTDLSEVLETFPRDKIIMGNISPMEIFNKGTHHRLERATNRLLRKYRKYENFIVSSGCDLPGTVEYSKINSFLMELDKYKK